MHRHGDLVKLREGNTLYPYDARNQSRYSYQDEQVIVFSSQHHDPNKWIRVLTMDGFRWVRPEYATFVTR